MTTTRKRLRLVGIYAACALLLFWALAPIYWVIVSSISTRVELAFAAERADRADGTASRGSRSAAVT